MEDEMRKIKVTLALVATLTSVQALEFGTMGSQAFGMGGVGVAIKHSPWGLYYNPSLIATDDGFKVGLHLGIQSKSQNFFQLFNRDFKNLKYDDINEMQKLLQNSRISLTSQDGVVLQLPDFGIGALAIGGFLNISANGVAKANLPSLNNGYRNTNVDSINLETNYSVLSLIEVPVGYAFKFETLAGDISIGTAVKYMNLSGTSGNFKIGNGTNLTDTFKDMLKMNMGKSVANVGVDVGVTYEPIDCFTIGLVGKNLNAPSFELNGQTYTIDPQARAGVAFNFDFFSLGLDADLTTNRSLKSDVKTQMIGVGSALDFSLFALRAGIATDLQHAEDLIFSLGVGITFLDIGIQFGKKTNPLNGMAMPDYLALQVGAGFSF